LLTLKKTLSVDWEMRVLNSFKLQIFSLNLIYQSFRINLKKKWMRSYYQIQEIFYELKFPRNYV